MRRKRFAALLGAAMTAATLVTTAGAGAGPSAVDRIDLSSRQGVNSYLTSLGIDPEGVVVQRGKRNYAGPNCPGRQWSCTTARKVVQISARGGVNRAVFAVKQQQEECTAPSDNDVHCKQRNDATPAVAQECTILQTGGVNRAHVEQVSHQRTGSLQTVQQKCTVTQTSTDGGDNYLHVRQDVNQSVKSGETQNQNAYQLLEVTQTTSGDGDNQVHVSQSQDQKATGGTRQSQNASPESPLGDCHDFGLSPEEPNACVTIDQFAEAGDNAVHLRQRIDQEATTKTRAWQQQGSPEGGIDGRVHQDTDTGTSVNNADQDKSHRVKAASGSTQIQYDPTACCGIGSQIGGVGNRESIDQDVKMAASEGAYATQEATVYGTSSSPTGDCTIAQNVKTETGQSHVRESLEPCPVLIVTTICTGASEGEGERTTGSCESSTSTECPPGFFMPDETGPCVPNEVVDITAAGTAQSLGRGLLRGR